jgi:hypothetical protein
MARTGGAFLVFLGCILLGLDSPGFDVVIAHLPVPGRHGVHLLDVVGFAVVVTGVVVLWREASRP